MILKTPGYMPVKTDTRAKASSYAAAIPLVAALFLAPSLWRGGVLLPLDILHHLGPFGASRPEALANVANPHLSDLVTMTYPWIELFRSGEAMLPLWNPYSFCGSPLAANAQTGVLFPMSWIYRLAPIGPASLAIALGKLMIAGFGALLYFRALGVWPLAALYGAIVTMLGGQLIVWLGYPGSFAVTIMPWLFWALERYVASRTLGSIGALGAAYGLLFLAGQPQFGLVIALASAVYLVAHAGFRPERRVRLYLGFTAAAVLGFCLAAPQILPFLEYLAESAAGRLRSGFGWKQYPWYTIVSLLVPRFFGDPRQENFWGFSSLLGEAAYAGAIAVPLAVVGAVSRFRERSVRAILAVLAVAASGLYLPVAQKLYLTLPLVRSLDNNKILVLVGFAVSVLAVFGLDAFVRAGRGGPSSRRSFVLWAYGATASAALAGGMYAYFRHAIRDLRLEQFEAREAAWFAAVMAAACVVVHLWRHRRLSARWAGTLLIAVTLGDIFRVWVGYHSSFSESYLRPRSESVEFLKERSADGRFLGLRGALIPETSVLYRLRDARGIEGLTPYRHYRIFGRIDSAMHDLEAHLPFPPPSQRWSRSTLFHQSLARLLERCDPAARAALANLDYWNTELGRIERPGLLSILGVRWLLAPIGELLPHAAGFRLVHSSDAAVWENPHALPRTFVATSPRFVDSDDAALDAISDVGFPLETTAVILGAGTAGGAGRIVPARIVRDALHDVEIRVDAVEGGWLVLSDLFYPGWSATVDGAPVEIARANFLFRAVKVEPGARTVRFVYRPGSFLGGAALAAAAVALIGGVPLASLVRRSLATRRYSRQSSREPGRRIGASC